MSGVVIAAIVAAVVVGTFLLAVAFGKALRRAAEPYNGHFSCRAEAYAALLDHTGDIDLYDSRHLAMLHAAGFGATPDQE